MRSLRARPLQRDRSASWQGPIRSAPTLALLALLALGCSPLAEIATAPTRPLELPPAELTGVRFEGFTGGARELELHAVRARVDAVSGLTVDVRAVDA